MAMPALLIQYSPRAGLEVNAVIDINPAKQHKYLPASGLQVKSPAEVLPAIAAGSKIFVMNSNYLEEIRDMSNNRFTYVSVDSRASQIET